MYSIYSRIHLSRELFICVVLILSNNPRTCLLAFTCAIDFLLGRAFLFWFGCARSYLFVY